MCFNSRSGWNRWSASYTHSHIFCMSLQEVEVACFIPVSAPICNHIFDIHPVSWTCGITGICYPTTIIFYNIHHDIIDLESTVKVCNR